MKIPWFLSKLLSWLLKESMHKIADGFKEIFLLICKFGNREVAVTVPIFKNVRGGGRGGNPEVYMFPNLLPKVSSLDMQEEGWLRVGRG